GYSAQANPAPTERTGTITIAGNTFTVTQSGNTCSPTVSPSSLTIARTGGSGTINVSSGCSWQTSSTVTWITITPNSGSGSGSVSYVVAANTGSQSRTG